MWYYHINYISHYLPKTTSFSDFVDIGRSLGLEHDALLNFAIEQLKAHWEYERQTHTERLAECEAHKMLAETEVH